MFASPTYQAISDLKVKVSSYNEALDNSKALEIERDKLSKKYSTISPNDLEKLEKLLPENVDNIRLILEIEKLSSPYGMSLKDVKYDTINTNAPKSGTNVIKGGVSPVSKSDYGTWNLAFSTSGTYDNFISFMKDLESNLRIVDIISIEFSASDSGNAKSTNITPVYKYDFKIKTYWLKN
jgi:Tfp pilus assembly protein PilO